MQRFATGSSSHNPATSMQLILASPHTIRQPQPALSLPSPPLRYARGRGGLGSAPWTDVRRHVLRHKSHGQHSACRSGQLKDGAKRRRGAARRRRVLDLA